MRSLRPRCVRVDLLNCCLVCLRWAEAADGSRRNGGPRGVADAWIAATAFEHDIPLVTNNASHHAGDESLTVEAEISQPE